MFHRITFRVWCTYLQQTSATCQHGTRGVTGQDAPLNKVYNSGMLKHTFRSSEILGEAAKNVIYLLYLLKCNISKHRSLNWFQPKSEISHTRCGPRPFRLFITSFIYTPVIFKRNYSLTTYYRIFSFNKEAIIFSKWDIHLQERCSL